MNFLATVFIGLVIGVVLACLGVIYSHFSDDPPLQPVAVAILIFGSILASLAFVYCSPEPY